MSLVVQDSLMSECHSIWMMLHFRNRTVWLRTMILSRRAILLSCERDVTLGFSDAPRAAKKNDNYAYHKSPSLASMACMQRNSTPNLVFVSKRVDIDVPSDLGRSRCHCVK